MVTSNFGNPDLYVTASTLGPHAVAGSYPTTHSYMWRAISSENHDMVHITASDPNRCASYGCAYLIGVLGKDASTSFTILCATSSSVVTLQYSVPLAGQRVVKDEYRYYEFSPSSNTEGIVIGVTMSTGDADIFVSFANDRPDKDHYQFKAEGAADCNSVECGNSISSGDAIHIPAGSLGLCPSVRRSPMTSEHGILCDPFSPVRFLQVPCVGYIAVFGKIESTFTLLISGIDDEQPITLQDGHRLYGNELNVSGAYAYYRVRVDHSSTSLRCGSPPRHPALTTVGC
jgi:hypothetical protein